jgi:probable DNA metabolism protein
MSDGANVVYIYDGSFEGMLCCVYNSYYNKENVCKIVNENENFQASLFDAKGIYTDKTQAEKVYKSIREKISIEAEELVTTAFLSCVEDKEMMILNFLRAGYKIGRKINSMLVLDEVAKINKAVRNLTMEAHKYKGFIRFSIAGKILFSTIEPNNNVLPLLAEHFTDRYMNENFIIYDKKRSIALVYRPREYVIVPIEEWQLPEVDKTEIEYRNLWKRFYDTIAIEDRYNPKCRMNLMPKRYWKHMTEFNVDSENNYSKLEK